MPSLDLFLQPEIFLVWTSALKTFVILGVVLTMVAYSVWAERKVSAFIQDRIGPNRVGWAGLIQPVADGVKLLLKENFVPGGVNKFFFSIAPSLAMIPSILVLAVLPFGSSLFGVPMVIANLDIGVLWVFAVSSLGVYGIVLAGWASNSKYPFLGGIRSSSQMISYELSLGLSVVPVFMITGTLNLGEIVQYQVDNGWMVFPAWFQTGAGLRDMTTESGSMFGLDLGKTLLWIPMMISFVVFIIAMFAETNRIPFDLPRGRAGIGRRLPHGILLNALCPFFPRRIRGHDRRVRGHCDPLPRRLEPAVCPGRIAGLVLGIGQYRHLLRQDCRDHLFLPLGALDPATIPLRSVDEARMVCFL